jgi:hypothetical protein
MAKKTDKQRLDWLAKSTKDKWESVYWAANNMPDNFQQNIGPNSPATP